MTMNRARRQLLAGMTSGALGSLGSLGSLGRLGSLGTLGTLGTVGTVGTLGGCASGVPLQSVAGRRILIIGAGFAGLSAANALQASGAEVIVLEARERAGGRVLTDRSLGFPLDLGPSWLHGGAGNPLKAIAASAGVATQVTDYSNLRFTSSVSGGAPGHGHAPGVGLRRTHQYVDEFTLDVDAPALARLAVQRRPFGRRCV